MGVCFCFPIMSGQLYAMGQGTVVFSIVMYYDSSNVLSSYVFGMGVTPLQRPARFPAKNVAVGTGA